MKIKKIIGVILTLLLSLTILSSCNISNNPSSTVATKLVKYNSYKSLQNAIEKRLKDSGRNGMNNFGKGLFQEAVADTGAPQKSNLQDYSKTNLQVEGVDEADIVKTDGRYLYIIANGRFIIVDAEDSANMKIVSTIQYIYVNESAKNIVTPVEMLLDEKNKHIILIANSYDDRYAKAMLTQAQQYSSGSTKPGVATDQKSEMAIAPDYYYYGMQNVLAQVIDLNDITKPTVIREFLQEGSYLSSRRIDEFVYIITNKYIYNFGNDTNKDFYIPATKDSATTSEWQMLPVDSISIVSNQTDNSFLVISSLNTNDKTTTVQTKAVLGAGQNIYASTTNIYIASARYTYDETVNNQGGVATGNVNEGTATANTTTKTEVAQDSAIAPDANGGTGTEPATANGGVTDPKSTDILPSDSTVVAPDKGDPITTVVKDLFQVFEPPVYKVFTDIYRFSINKAEIKENGSAVVPGYILNQFSMDENNGFFRIATTTGDSWRSDKYTSMNNVYILDSALKLAGKIEGLASRETIKSVRFLGNKAYLVTFRTVDPLFVLDLTDPKNPSVKGELKIPGYSEYLHPVSDTIVIGFGKDAFEENNMAFYLGMKVSVFDVSDVSNPKEISTMLIGDRGTNSEVSFNHKALLYSKENNIIGFPITIYSVPESQKADRHAYGIPTFTGFMVLGLTSGNKLFERGRVSHFNLEIPAGYQSDSSPKSEDWAAFDKLYQSEYLYKVNRGMFIGDTLFTVSNAFIKSTSLKEFKAIDSISVPGFNEIYQNQYPVGVK